LESTVALDLDSFGLAADKVGPVGLNSDLVNSLGQTAKREKSGAVSLGSLHERVYVVEEFDLEIGNGRAAIVGNIAADRIGLRWNGDMRRASRSEECRIECY